MRSTASTHGRVLLVAILTAALFPATASALPRAVRHPDSGAERGQPAKAGILRQQQRAGRQQQRRQQERGGRGQEEQGEREPADGGDARLEEGASGRLHRGQRILGFRASYGLAQVINRSADIDIATAGVRWSRLYRARGPGFLRGHPTLAVELLPLMRFDQVPDAWGGGFNVMYEHHFATSGAVMPYFNLGVGFLYTNDRVPPGETRHNFTLLTGFGLAFALGEKTALTTEYRLHHVSNAGTGFRNPGINAHTVMLGIALYLE